MRIRRCFSFGVLMLVCFTGTAVGAVPADPVLASSCATVMEGVAGQAVVLDPRAVGEPITEVLKGLDPLGILVAPFRQVWNGLPPVPLGTVPVGELMIDGTHVAEAVVQRLREIPLLAPVLELLVPPVRSVLGAACGILARAADQPDVPDPEAPAPPLGPSAPGDSPGLSDRPGRPRWNWDTTGASYDPIAGGKGGGTRFGTRLGQPFPAGAAIGFRAPGAAPGQGVPGPDAPSPLVANARRPAGTAVALPAERKQLSQPVALLAVLLLTVVSAQLVRTWVLRAQH
ncbi:hypothetical protein [Amycolatopsis nigrescens]|uniref:hypothetical protein n=1 Tax=Amycolatopsis nigrescens TaxID=381445 RepID=UPI00037CAEA9|nr:hypothetical protein [Amycolatopsis nigrescens]